MDRAKKSNETKSDYEKKGEHAFTMGNILEAAEWYYKAGNFGRAAELFEWGEKYERAAQNYFKNQEYIAAAHNYLKVPIEEMAGEMFELAREFKKAGDIALKFKNYSKAGELYERSRDYFHAGESFFLANDKKKAIFYLEKVEQTDPDFLKVLLRMAEIFLKMGKPQWVVDKIGPLLENKQVDKSDIDWFYALGQAYEGMGDFVKAVDIYRDISKVDSNYPGIEEKIKEVGDKIKKYIEMGNIERYKKLKEVGRGSMAVVYRAEDLHLKRVVALKILNAEDVGDDSDIDRFLSEAQKVAQLQHPNIVTAYDVGKMGANYFISMEFIEGISLTKLIYKQHPLPFKEILIITKKMFFALAHSHQKGVIHRDIKPNNIMVTYENDIKVVDFGIAALIEEMKEKGREIISGTPCYMSPEQIEGTASDHRADIYSVGVTLFHMVSGRPPFEGSMQEIFKKHLMEPLYPIKELRPDTPEGLVRIIEKCMAKDKEKRYQGAWEVLEEIDKIQDLNGKAIITDRSELKIFAREDNTNILIDRHTKIIK